MHGPHGHAGGLMAELIDFGYGGRPTAWHGIDARVKLIAMVALSLSTLTAGPGAMALATALIGAALLPLRHKTWHLFFRLKFFWLLLVAVILARALTTPGELLIQWHYITLSRPGLVLGVLIAWRLLVIVWLSLLITATTAADDIRNAVHWILNPLPLVKGQILSDMIMLLMRFMPMILIRAQQISDAQHSRLVSCRKNPFYRIRHYAMPLLRRSFLQSEQLSFAMAARCYHQHRLVKLPPLKPTDKWCAVFVVFFCLALMVI